MDEKKEDALFVDPALYSLTDYDRVRIEMPKPPMVTEGDIDAQLFAYVASAPKGSPVRSIADLDDAWVQANLPAYSTIGELRNAIRATLIRETAAAFDEAKFQKCADVLVGRLEGELPADVVEAHSEEVRKRNEEMLAMQGASLARYLEDSRMSKQDYEAKLREEAEREVALNVALDKMIEVTATTVGMNELTDYLACEDPEAFLEELGENGRMADACAAAARVKVMRRVVETAEVEAEGAEKTV